MLGRLHCLALHVLHWLASRIFFDHQKRASGSNLSRTESMKYMRLSALETLSRSRESCRHPIQGCHLGSYKRSWTCGCMEFQHYSTWRRMGKWWLCQRIVSLRWKQGTRDHEPSEFWFRHLDLTVRRIRQLLRIVLKLNANIKNPNFSTSAQTGSILAAEDIHLALMRASQLTIQGKNFQQWRGQFGLFLDNNGLWRCGGRLENADAPEKPNTGNLPGTGTKTFCTEVSRQTSNSCAPSNELCKGEGSCASSQYAGDYKENPIHYLLLHYLHLRVNEATWLLLM